MGNIYNYSKHAFLELKQQTNRHPYLIFVLLLLLTIPLNYAVNSIALALFTIFTVITFRKTHFVYNATLLLPVLLYGLMLCSLAWSIDSENTIKALSKEIPLLLIPIAFMMFPAFSTGQRKMIVKWYSWGIFAYC